MRTRWCRWRSAAEILQLAQPGVHGARFRRPRLPGAVHQLVGHGRRLGGAVRPGGVAAARMRRAGPGMRILSPADGLPGAAAGPDRSDETTRRAGGAGQCDLRPHRSQPRQHHTGGRRGSTPRAVAVMAGQSSRRDHAQPEPTAKAICPPGKELVTWRLPRLASVSRQTVIDIG
jgi:hypothetical protein